VRSETTVKANGRRTPVQKLLMNGEFPVDELTAKIYFASNVG
jgi:hypothetical protein